MTGREEDVRSGVGTERWHEPHREVGHLVAEVSDDRTAPDQRATDAPARFRDGRLRVHRGSSSAVSSHRLELPLRPAGTALVDHATGVGPEEPAERLDDDIMELEAGRLISLPPQLDVVGSGLDHPAQPVVTGPPVQPFERSVSALLPLELARRIAQGHHRQDVASGIIGRRGSGQVRRRSPGSGVAHPDRRRSPGSGVAHPDRASLTNRATASATSGSAASTSGERPSPISMSATPTETVTAGGA